MIEKLDMILSVAKAIQSCHCDSLQIDRLDIQYKEHSEPGVPYGYYGYLTLYNGAEYKIFEDGTSVRILTGDMEWLRNGY